MGTDLKKVRDSTFNILWIWWNWINLVLVMVLEINNKIRPAAPVVGKKS